MATETLPQRGSVELLSAMGLALVGGVATFAVVLMLSGQFGMVLKGIRLTDPAEGPISTTLLHLAVAAGATAGAFFGPTAGQSPVARPAARAGLAVLAVLLFVTAPRGSTLVMIALPTAVVLVALVVTELRLRREEPLRTASANDFLWTSLLLASAYGVVLGLLT